MHDSQVAILLATMSSQRVTLLYNLMDAAYDCEEIKLYCHSLGHITIIDENPRRYGKSQEKLDVIPSEARDLAIHIQKKILRCALK